MSRKNKYDWTEIEKFCEEESKSKKEISEKFGCSITAINLAIKEKKLSSDGVKNTQRKYEWEKLQKDLDAGYSWRDLSRKYGISNKCILNAGKTGKLKLRTKSEALTLAHKKSPRLHSQKTKEKISFSRKEFLKNNPDKVPYKLYHKSKGPSYPEKYFRKLFNDLNLKLTPYYRFHTYELDFAHIEKKIDIEIDGDQHIFDLRIVQHDKKRDKFMTQNGWRVVRVVWSDYKRLNYDEKQKFIHELVDFLK